MPLNKTQLANSIKATLNDMKTREQDSTNDLANALADAIDTYVKGMKVTSVPTLTNSGGPVTGTITNTVS